MNPRKNDNVRAFIALELSHDIKQAIADYVAPMRALDKGLSWTKAENVHLTLKFLGDTPKAQIENVSMALREVCMNFAPIAAEIFGSGVFSNEHRPRVLWIGIKESSGKLAELAQRIESECRRLGFEKEERGFSPHLTIGRVKAGKAANVVKAMRESPFPSQQIVFQECTLMQCVLHSAGSIYTPVLKAAFNVRVVNVDEQHR
ncbi:MAG: RNA 2',3'-cyclic phosphodiesterase [candidate division KSB1 bacterium]